MVMLLRSCILSQRKLFAQECMLFKRIIVFNGYNTDVKNFTSKFQVRHYASEQNKNEDQRLIYTGYLSTNIRNIKLFSLLSSTLTIVFQPIIYMKILEEDNTASLGALCALVNFVCIGTPVVLYMLSRRYVLELYYRPEGEKYIAKVYNFFLKRREIEFTANDVQPLDGAPFTTCIVHNKYPLLLDETYFTEPKHYFIIMGYNKPVDFEVEKLEVQPLNQAPVISESHRIENKSNDKQ